MNTVRTLSNRLKSYDIDGMVREFVGMKEIQNMFKARTPNVSSDQFESYMKHVIVPNALRASQTGEFREIRYGSRETNDRRAITPRELMPTSYLASYDAGKYVGSRFGNNKIFSGGRKQLIDLISRYDAAARAAFKSGMIEYDKDNNPFLTPTITSTMVNGFRKSLLKDLTVRANGQQWRFGNDKRDFFNPTDKTTSKIIASITSGSGGRALEAMQLAEFLVDPNNWVSKDQAPPIGRQAVKFDAKRELEYYGISKYNFADLAEGKKAKGGGQRHVKPILQGTFSR